MNMNIVCTGYGILAPNTKNIDEFLFNLQNGVCCLDVVEGEGPNNETNIVGLIKEGIEELDKNKKLKRLPRVTKLGIIAAKEAIRSAQLDVQDKKVGLFLGTSLGATGEKLYQKSIKLANNEQYKKMPITFTHYANYHSITASIVHSLGVNGITKTLSTGCTSGLESIEEALLYLKSGKIDVAIVVGTDSAICNATTYAFARTRSLPLEQTLEEGAVPFQEGSKGFAMAEASGAIILERKEEAIDRGADIKGEVVDVVSNNDGEYIFSPNATGEQLINALKEITNGRNPDYINSQALGIHTNDQIEKRGSEELFNHQIPYTSIKGMYGNPFSATGMLQVISSLLCVQYNFIPPTTRTSKKGYENMNIVTETKHQEIKEVAITNHGLGGNNVCAYIKKY